MNPDIIPSPQLVPYPDLRHPKTGEPLNVAALAQFHYSLSTAVLIAAEKWLSSEMDLPLPLDGCWRSDLLNLSAEKFANDCLVAAIGDMEDVRRANARDLDFLASQDTPAPVEVTA